MNGRTPGLVLIQGASVYAPRPLGVVDVLLAGNTIARLGHDGPIEPASLAALGLPLELIDGRGKALVPGLVDPHAHLLGGSGERGWSSQTPELGLAEIALGAITTVVGCLGTDATTKTMLSLYARSRALSEEGLSTYLYAGGYALPPSTLTGSILTDILLVEPVIGAGEIAISDLRGSAPTVHELARLCAEAGRAGLLSGKAGVVHVHVGGRPGRLEPLRRLLDEHDIDPSWLYATHVERTPELVKEAAEISRRGVTVDMDTVEEDLCPAIEQYLAEGGDLTRLSISSDAGKTSPKNLHRQLCSLVSNGAFSLERALPFFTENAARALRLPRKGSIAEGHDADLALLDEGSLAVREVVASGRVLVRDGQLSVVERFLEESNRTIELRGRA